MQTSLHRRAFVALGLVLAGCSGGDNPYSRLTNTPLVQARPHAVTLLGAPELGKTLRLAGYEPLEFPANYQEAVHVQALVWDVPEPVAAAPTYFKAKQGLDVRLLTGDVPRRLDAPPKPDPAVERAFFRNVLGTDVPAWPAGVAQPETARVQAWTFFIPDVVAAKKTLRENGIPVVFDPVALTSAYLGDHKVMGIRAPDGTVIELVESAAQ